FRFERGGLVFFQAEDGIRDRNVTGVQTCALPISSPAASFLSASPTPPSPLCTPTLLNEPYAGAWSARGSGRNPAAMSLSIQVNGGEVRNPAVAVRAW